jgi:hypothetical protein
MDIDDIIKTKFKGLDKFLTEEMYQTAGKELVDKMIEVLETKDVRGWYYSETRGLNYERPYDYCRKGKQKEVKKLLGRIEHGIF